MIGETGLQLLNSEYQKREVILDPWLRSGELVLLFAPRGIGKTYFCLSMAYSLILGCDFLNWRNNRKRKVFFLDGEMGRAALAARLAQITNTEPELENFTALTFEHCGGVIRNISDPIQQEIYNRHFEGADIIIIDNLLSCSAPLDNKDDELRQWQRIQTWLIQLRSEGKTVILVHHAGKSGLQLGTSTRENIVDTIVNLKGSRLTKPANGKSAELHFEKTRNFYGDSTNPIHLEYTTELDKLDWNVQDLLEIEDKTINSLSIEMKNRHNIAAKLNIPLWRVCEVLDKPKVEENSYYEPKEDPEDELF